MSGRYSVRLLVLCVVLGLLVGVVSGFVVRGGEVSDLRTQVGSLQRTQTQLESRISSLESDVTTKALEVNRLLADNLNKTNWVSSLTVQLADKDRTIGTLNSLVAGLQQNLTLRDSRISVLEEDVDALEDQVLVLESQVGAGVLGVYFSPQGGCQSQLLYWISRANVSIQILIYSFTLDSVGDALVAAQSRGVSVQAVFETSQIDQYSEYAKLKNAGIDVRTDTNPSLMHNKVMIVDGLIVITGSYNWSVNAEQNNNENFIIVNVTYVAQAYTEEFSEIWDSSQVPPSDGGGGGTTPQAAVVISYVHYDAVGDDNYNLNDEYVVLQNPGTAAASLTGWRLRDLYGHQYTFPSFSLGAGQTVTVHTGSGANTQSDLYWGYGSAIWNNDHDTAYLYDTQGQLVDSSSW